MYFLALSQAPPPLLRTVARRTPAIVPTIRKPGHGLVAEEEADEDRRERRRRMPGATISRSAARVVMSTTRA